jgi:tetratricopeptide (TPR) repeat protein
MNTHWLYVGFLFSFCFSCSGAAQKTAPQKLTSSPEEQQAIIEEFHTNGALKHHVYSPEWQEYLDAGLAKDSTIAYLWQQKAMPLFKQGKYELGMTYIDQAVRYNPQRYLDYRAFIKCIFAKTYREAIKDFQAYQAQYGYGYVMDHSYDFYIALCKIQLNEFTEAETILRKDLDHIIKEVGPSVVHHLDVFYLGICKYEQRKFAEAIEAFDWAIELYSQFSDAQYYKSRCLMRLGQLDEARQLYQLAKANAQKGYTINEDNAIYERYPYQKRWSF